MAQRLLLARAVAFVQLTGIRKAYEGVARPVIPNLDLEIDAHSMVVLVGPSGCGKSTTLRMVAGLEEPTAGTIAIDGRDVTHLPPAERDIAMVFQSYALYPHMTVFDNMAFGLRIKKVAPAQITERVTRAAESLGLTPYLGRLPKALSGGQRQRVAIGRAVVREPKVFLFDEPLSNLDAKLRGEMRREIARIHKASNATSMYVTHDQIEAMTLADKIVVLKDGVVQQVGSPVEIYEQPANRFVAGFFGTPTMNFLSAELAKAGEVYSVRGPGFEIPLGGAGGPYRAAPLPADSAAAKVVVGIRPEQLAVGRARRPGADVAVTGEVAMREVLGAEVVLHVESAAGALTVRTEAASAPGTGERVDVWVDAAAIHLFDGSTEERM